MIRNNQEQLAVLLKQGTKALQRGAIQEATGLLERAHALDSRNVDVRLNLSSALILGKKFKKAAHLLKQLTAEQPHNEMVWLNLGAAHLGNPVLAGDEDQQEAIKAFKRAIAINPHTPNAAYNLGLVYRDRQEHQQALHWFSEAGRTAPDDRDAHYYVEQMKTRLAEEAD